MAPPMNPKTQSDIGARGRHLRARCSQAGRSGCFGLNFRATLRFSDYGFLGRAPFGRPAPPAGEMVIGFAPSMSWRCARCT